MLAGIIEHVIRGIFEDNVKGLPSRLLGRPQDLDIEGMTLIALVIAGKGTFMGKDLIERVGFQARGNLRRG